MPRTTIPVTERALLARVNRAMAKSDKVVKKVSERSRMWPDYGPYYMLNTDTNTVAASTVDLQELARELDKLGEWERVEP